MSISDSFYQRNANANNNFTVPNASVVSRVHNRPLRRREQVQSRDALERGASPFLLLFFFNFTCGGCVRLLLSEFRDDGDDCVRERLHDT